MDNAIIAKNKTRMEQEQARLKKLLSQVEDKTGAPKYPDFGSTDEDNAAEVTAYEANIAEDFDLEQKLQLVNAALARIEAKGYGICQIGGEEISAARLEAVPEAANCVEHDSQKI